MGKLKAAAGQVSDGSATVHAHRQWAGVGKITYRLDLFAVGLRGGSVEGGDELVHPGKPWPHGTYHVKVNTRARVMTSRDLAVMGVTGTHSFPCSSSYHRLKSSRGKLKQANELSIYTT